MTAERTYFHWYQLLHICYSEDNVKIYAENHAAKCIVPKNLPVRYSLVLPERRSLVIERPCPVYPGHG